jgi:hypothetical protein
MNIQKDFVGDYLNNCIDHKSLPITVFLNKINRDKGCYTWYYNFYATFVEDIKRIDELHNVSPEDVTEEQISLILLKYSAL